MPLDDDQRRRRRNRKVLTIVTIGASAATMAYLGWPCTRYGECGAIGRLLAVATSAIVIAIWLLLRGSDKVVFDDEGLVIHRHRAPWAAVRTIAWVYDADRRGPVPMIEIGLREATGYKPPRARRLRFDPDDLETTPAEFWAVVQERTPHHVLVLNTPPGVGTTGA